jgi:hypothetical protein
LLKGALPFGGHMNFRLHTSDRAMHAAEICLPTWQRA